MLRAELPVQMKRTLWTRSAIDSRRDGRASTRGRRRRRGGRGGAIAARGCGLECRLVAARLKRVARSALAVDGTLARGEEGLPRHALRIEDPGLLALGVAARRLALLVERSLGGFQPA